MIDEDKERYDFNDAIGKFVEKCREGYARFGAANCVAVCPIGWPDLGDWCVKNEFIVFDPFLWTAGDGGGFHEVERGGL